MMNNLSLHSLAISGALCEHPVRPHPDQGQLCCAGGYCGHQGHLPQVPQQVGSLLGIIFNEHLVSLVRFQSK